MANAASLTVTTLNANDDTARPTGDAFDTGSDPVTVYTAALGECDRLIFEVTNSAAANLTATVLAGDNPPAFRAGLGSVSGAAIAQNGVQLLGPFESARFMQNDGTVGLTLTPASGTIGATVRAYKLPKA